jgi:hypothetical protein
MRWNIGLALGFLQGKEVNSMLIFIFTRVHDIISKCQYLQLFQNCIPLKYGNITTIREESWILQPLLRLDTYLLWIHIY